jgi:uncharacterized protein (TIGR03663 family)
VKPTWLFAACILGVTGAALALRLPALAVRPMHTDEAVHAVKFDTLWQTGRYEYDPNEYHGPTLYYFSLPAMWLSGARNLAETNEITFRVTPALFGVGLILVLPLFADGLGRPATVIAALLTALSSAMVFYSRYYIQEMLLAFFTLAAIAAGWRLVRSPRLGWALLLGCLLGLMHATKETSIIAFGCLAVAAAAAVVWRGPSSRTDNTAAASAGRDSRVIGCEKGFSHQQVRLLAVSTAAAVVTSAMFYSGFFTHLRGAWDSLASLTTYFQRAGGGGIHEQPWHYYLGMLLWTHYGRGPVWTEAAILLLAILGVVAAWRAARARPVDAAGQRHQACGADLRRFLAIYGLLMVLTYSIVPYKTPWCLVQFLVPLILLASSGASVLLRGSGRRRAVIGVMLAAVMMQLGWQACRASFRYYADYRNPYVYAHPLLGVVRMSEWVERLARVHPDGHRMLIRVVMDDPWPLPWYLRRFERVGYWESPPEDGDAAVIITSADLAQKLDAKLDGDYQISHYGLRPDVVLLVYVERSLWEAFAAQR